MGPDLVPTVVYIYALYTIDSALHVFRFLQVRGLDERIDLSGTEHGPLHLTLRTAH